ncbi:hypothetical protein HCN44_000150 [Aphidius gifuensis]|uniref:Cytochrome P450 n=1 Tax=Aphidius gifuensis TaxID=684658 RepID=A0A834XNG9_APHGI|nr:methyl farnesoate epoxidase-like [Aphidius gifuensis]KAF7990345.1 hypothetical protein HCN44_000150 [Aphidius gifuensis]
MWFSLLVTCIFICFIKLILSWRRPSSFPNGPKGLPIVGNLFDLKNLVDKFGSHGAAWCQLANEYGPVVGLRLGFGNPLIIISGYDAVMEMLNRREFDGRPNGFIFSHRTHGKKRGVLFTDGKTWTDQRRFSIKCLKDLGWGRQTMEELILEDAGGLIKNIETLSKKGVIKNLNNLTNSAVINSLWSLIGGTRYDVAKGDAKIMKTLQILNDSIRESNVSGGLLNHFPFLRFIAPRLSGYRTITDRYRLMWSFFSAEVSSHKASKKPGIMRDLIDTYLEEIKEHEEDPTSSFNEMELIALLKDLFSAGVDTTTNSIGFTLDYLTVNPHVQAKVHEELDRVIGRDNLPSITTRNSLPYLNATLAEVLRLSNIGPTTIPHRCTIDNTKFMNFNIKKNYTLLANIMSVHLDKEHWGDPEVFRPERFINEDGVFVVDPWLMPFGAGRRKCLGEALAKNGHFLFVSSLLQKFEFQLPPGHSLPSMTGMDGFTLSPPIFDILVLPR